MLLRIFPGLVWLKHYSSGVFRSDLVSGLTIGIMLIPQSMGYAVVAGLPPEAGLYASVFPPIVYALLGTSNKISIGPVALDSILILTGLRALAEPGGESYLELAVTLTLLVGALQLVFGLLKFGFIANFLSYPVIVGYTSAAAVIIIVGQFPLLVGTSVEGGNPLEQVFQLLLQMGDWNQFTVVISGVAFALIFLCGRFAPSVPAALLALVVSMLVSGVVGFGQFGVDTISSIPQGLPDFALPSLALAEIGSLLPVAFTVALMGYVGTISICKEQESPKDRSRINPNQELVAVGAANIFGAFVRAFPVSASFSRSAAFRKAGARTQVSAVISAILLALVLLFLTPLFSSYPLPKSVLAVVIVISVSGLFKSREMQSLLRQSRGEFGTLLLTLVATLFLGVQQGLIVGVVVSISLVIYKTANPHMTELGLIEGENLYRNITRFGQAKVRDDLLIFRFDAPLYFANKDVFLRHLYGWIERRPSKRLRSVIFDGEAVNSIDSTAIRMLEQLIEKLAAEGIQFYFTNLIGPVRDALTLSSLKVLLEEEHSFSTIQDAVLYIDEGTHRRRDIALQSNF